MGGGQPWKSATKKSYEKVSCVASQPKSLLYRQTMYISDKIIQLQSSLNEVNQALFAGLC